MTIDFKIGKQKYAISTLKIRDYYAIQSALLMQHDAIAYDLVSLLSGCPVDDLKNLNPQTWVEIWSALEIKIEKETIRGLEARNKISLHGVEYGLVDFEHMSIGEFADLDVLLQDPNMTHRLHEILAILYRPIVKESLFKYEIAPYSTEDYRARAELFLDLPIRHAKAVLSFFLSTAIASSGLTTLYLNLPRQTQQEMQECLLPILIGRGTPHSFTSLMKILWTSTELPNSEFEKHLTSWFGEGNKSDVKLSNVSAWLKNITLQDDLVS